MRTTMDAAGGIVIPEALRAAVGLTAGTELLIELRDGRIAIEPAPAALRVVARQGGAVLQAATCMPPISADAVRAVLDDVRR